MFMAGAEERKLQKNGFIKTPVICPEMCCYCFDVLIGYIQDNGCSNSSMKNFFPDDE
jgi:hypothetical protein